MAFRQPTEKAAESVMLPIYIFVLNFEDKVK